MHNKSFKWKIAAVAVFIVFVGAVAAPRVPGLPQGAQSWLDQFRMSLGLDLQGGLHLEYKMDLSQVADDRKSEAVDAVQAVIERRANIVGTSEAKVHVSQRASERFVIVELPGIKDIEQAKSVIKETPTLEFREERTEEEIETELAPLNEAFRAPAEEALVRAQEEGANFDELVKELSQNEGAQEDLGVIEVKNDDSPSLFLGVMDDVLKNEELADGTVHDELIESALGYHVVKKLETQGEGDERIVKGQHIFFYKLTPQVVPEIAYKSTELTGQYVEAASVAFGGGQGAGVSAPEVLIQFNSEGAKLFKELTERNVDKTIAIAVDDQIVSAPVVQVIITDGQALISGNFTLDDAKILAGRLNEGALPVPIELVSQQSIEASLGNDALVTSVKAGFIGLAFVMVYMIIYYRFLGLIAATAIGIYATTIVTIFKLSSALPGLSITLSLAGIAGLILSIGMAVDANILIFERINEELRRGRRLKFAIDEGFHRAWSAIRDGNISTILTSLILMFIGTGFVKGFAIILVFGVLVSMFTAVVLVRIIVQLFATEWIENHLWLFSRARKEEK